MLLHIIIIIILIMYFLFKFMKSKKNIKTNTIDNIVILDKKNTWVNPLDNNISFKINPKAKVTIHNIYKDTNVIVIDNFLLNIDELSNQNRLDIIAEKSDITWDDIHPYPGLQYPITINNSNQVDKIIKKLVNNKLTKFSETKLVDDPVLSVGMKFKEKNLYTTNPHFDVDYRYNYAAMLFLNKPNDCYGGTGIYESKLINNIYPYVNGKIININKNEFTNLYKKNSDVIMDSNSHWKLIDVLKMKYNRLIIYESCLFHSMYLKSFDLFKKYRYTINMWFDSSKTII